LAFCYPAVAGPELVACSLEPAFDLAREVQCLMQTSDDRLKTKKSCSRYKPFKQAPPHG
jgi:hypothetical protein